MSDLCDFTLCDFTLCDEPQGGVVFGDPYADPPEPQLALCWKHAKEVHAWVEQQAWLVAR